MSSHNELSDRDIQQLLHKMVGCRVAVVGDVILDEYLIGPVQRISPEAPVPVLEIEREEAKLGGAANVACCLSALGADVQLVGAIGNDAAGTKLQAQLASTSVGSTGLVVDSSRPTTCKTRIVAGQQQVVRLDRERRNEVSGDVARQVIAQARLASQQADVVVLSDYAKGVLSHEVCRTVIDSAGPRPVIVDPKDLPWSRYQGATVVKPNRLEMERYLGGKIDTDAQAAAAAQQLAEALRLDHGLITRGPDGMTAATRDGDAWATHHVRARRRELVDVTGAGDVTSAVLALALAVGAKIDVAMWLANLAAGIEIQNFGATPVSASELVSAGRQGQGEQALTLAEATTWAAERRRQGQRVVFTNGCFDLLHVGHVNYLEASRHLGDALIVGLNSDDSIKKLKGPTRPIQTQADRAHILASLSAVNAVTIFDEETPYNLIRAIRPDILTKGKDYRDKHAVVGWDLVESWGGTVELIEFVAGKSTSKLITQAAA